VAAAFGCGGVRRAGRFRLVWLVLTTSILIGICASSMSVPITLEDLARRALDGDRDALDRLDRPHRAAYVLGEIMELSGPEGAEILEIAPALFRKRLQIAREAVIGFMRSHCGLVSDTATCQCHRRVSPASVASADGSQPSQFARHPTSFLEARAPWCGASTRRAGRVKSIAPANRGPQRSIAPSACCAPSIRRRSRHNR
jgi:hypothetical protein